MMKHQVSDQAHIYQLRGVFGLIISHVKSILEINPSYRYTHRR